MSRSMAFAMESATSCEVGQMSFRWTGWPSLPTPSGSVVMSLSTLPAMA